MSFLCRNAIRDTMLHLAVREFFLIHYWLQNKLESNLTTFKDGPGETKGLIQKFSENE